MNKIKFRLSIKETTEVYEIINYSDDSVIDSFAFPLGQTLADFIYCDFNKAYDLLGATDLDFLAIRHKHVDIPKLGFSFSNDTNKLYKDGVLSSTPIQDADEIQKWMKEMQDIHVFFYIYSLYISDILYKYYTNDTIPKADYYLTNKRLNAKKHYDTLKAFVAFCLDIDKFTDISLFSRYNGFIAWYQDTQPEDWSFDLKTNCPIYTDFKPETKAYTGKDFKQNNGVFDTIYPETFDDLITFILSHCIKNEVSFRVCQNCERYFVLDRNKKAKYCDRPVIDSKRTCRQYGPLKVYTEQKKKDPIFTAYNKAYMQQYLNYKNDEISKETFSNWSAEASKLRKQCDNNELSLEEFEESLLNN